MILIAALAIGLPESFATLTWHVQPDFSSSDEGVWFTRHNTLAIVRGLSPCLASVTIALTALQWRRPRLTFRMLGRSPGVVACSVATVMVVVEAIFGFESGGLRSFDQYSLSWLPFVTRSTGGAVAGAWLTLAFSGHWPWDRRNNLDRIGQVLGACWVIFYLSMFYNNDAFDFYQDS